MNNDDTKKIKRITAVVYLIFMLFIVGGTYLSQRQKEVAKTPDQTDLNLQKIPN